MISRSEIKKNTAVVCSLLLFALLIFFPSDCAEGALTGLKNCALILIPSLFPYMLLSLFVMYTGTDEKIGRLFSPVVRILFDLPPICAAPIILSLTGGYPVGAGCVRALYSDGKITLEQARRMMYFCVCPGPAFMITAIGAVMLRNNTAGIILYCSQVISSLVIGIFLGIISRMRPTEKNSADIRKIQKNKVILSSAFINAARDSSSTVITMTALVTVFSVFTRVLHSSGIVRLFCETLVYFGAGKRESEVIFPIILEVTGGCCSVNDSGLPLWWFAFAAGFGGLCVHLQILSVSGDNKIMTPLYLLFRIINSILSGIIVMIFCIFYNPTEEVFLTMGGETARLTSTGPAGSIALLILCILFVLSFHGRRSFRRS